MSFRSGSFCEEMSYERKEIVPTTKIPCLLRLLVSHGEEDVLNLYGGRMSRIRTKDVIPGRFSSDKLKRVGIWCLQMSVVLYSLRTGNVCHTDFYGLQTNLLCVSQTPP